MSDALDRARAERWSDLASIFRAHVPELDDWWQSWAGDIEQASPAGLWDVLWQRLLDADYAPNIEHLGVWIRVLALVEVVEEALEIVHRVESEASDDAIQLYAFANAGILCEIGWNRDGLIELLPFMGPLTAKAARHEITYHDNVRRKWQGQDVDWSAASSRFQALDISPNDVLPPDLRRN